jgi:hypothetical protein
MVYPRFAFLAASLFLAGTALATPITFLEMHSQAGDYIGQGRNYLFDSDDGVWGARQQYYGNPAYLNKTVEISFHTSNYSEWWYLDFSSVHLGTDLGPGSYQAQRFPFEANGYAGLDVSGDGRGSNQLSGTFTILDLAFGANGAVDRFAATFEQHSEFRAQALTGRVSYNSEAFSPVPEPGSMALFPLGLGLLWVAGSLRRRGV